MAKQIKQAIWTKKMVDDATDKISNGFILSGSENPFYDGVVGLRKSGIVFKMTQLEVDEYIKCKIDIHYFAEKYCYVKGEKGEPVKLVLRDYQKEILDNFFNNRFNILMASRQIGKCLSFNTLCKIKMKNIEIDIRIGNLYYMLLSTQRKLTILEKLKIKLYQLLYLLERKP